MREHSCSEVFARELNRALSNLYDPRELRRNDLVKVLPLTAQEDAGLGLRRLLVEAIEALKPGNEVPPQSMSWRIYHVLSQRYVEQSTQRQVATDLGLSIRQLRRLENEVRDELAGYLCRRYGLALSAAAIDGSAGPPDKDAVPSAEVIPSCEEELDWLQRSAPSEPTSAQQVVQEVLCTAAPLASALQVNVEHDVSPDLPPLAAQVTALRQGLLSVLVAAIRLVPGGKVAVNAQADRHGAHITVHSSRGAGVPGPRANGEVDGLQMARELVQVSGGELQVLSAEGTDEPFVAKLSFHVAEQVAVLAIDDNPDIISLFQRYVSDTRYRLAGAGDLPHALVLLSELAPQIIVLDVMLPGADGWQLLGRLREHPKGRGIPIIICTVIPQEQLALTLGAAGFLRKPVTQGAFLAALDAQLETRSRRPR